jgi:hypothetical protein
MKKHKENEENKGDFSGSSWFCLFSLTAVSAEGLAKTSHFGQAAWA